MPLFEKRGHGIVNVDQFSEGQIKAVAAADEHFSVSAVRLVGIIHLSVQITGFGCFAFEIRTGVADVRRLSEFFAYKYFEFRAPFIACSRASSAAQYIAIHMAAGMAHTACVDLRAAIGIVFDLSTVALDLTTH